MAVKIAPRPTVRGLTFVCWIDLARFITRRMTPVPRAKTGLLMVAPKLPPKLAATTPNQTRKTPQKRFVKVSGRKSESRPLPSPRF